MLVGIPDLTTTTRRCKQMQIAERDARHATDLKAQIGELQGAIEQISQQIVTRHVFPDDEEQAQILDEMKEMRQTSTTLQRRATLRLEYLTSLTEDATVDRRMGTGADEFSFSVAATQGKERSSLSPPLEREESDSLPMVDPSSPTPPAQVSTPASPEYIRAGDTSAVFPFNSDSVIAMHQRPSTVDLQLRKLGSEEAGTISAHEFEDASTRLLATAAAEFMGTKKPFSDDVIAQLATLLNAVGKNTWSERPRTYLVLRLISEIKSMDVSPQNTVIIWILC